MNLKRLLVTAALAGWAVVALALPSVEAVQAEVQKGHYAQAETMMQEVVAAKPGSARAHYIYAEILAHNGRFDEARRQASAAREADPAISFTDPAKFKALEQSLGREAQAARPATQLAAPAAPVVRYSPPVVERSQGIPGWVWAFGLAGVAAVVWMMTRRRSMAAAGPMAAPAMGGVAPAGYGPGYPGYGPQAPSSGPGMLGVGLAAAGGVAAGMLAERLLEGGRHDGGGSVGNVAGGSGFVPGMFDDVPDRGAARELEDRPIDFGSGDGWGGGDDGSSSGGDGGW